MLTTVERSPCSLLHRLLPRPEFRVWAWFPPYATSAGDADCFRHSQIIYQQQQGLYLHPEGLWVPFASPLLVSAAPLFHNVFALFGFNSGTCAAVVHMQAHARADL